MVKGTKIVVELSALAWSMAPTHAQLDYRELYDFLGKGHCIDRKIRAMFFES